MPERSRGREATNWDLTRVPRNVEGPPGVSTWTRTAAARVVAVTLSGQDEFWDHVVAVRTDDARTEDLARRYFRRAHSQRVPLLAVYLRTAAARSPFAGRSGDRARPDENPARIALYSIGRRSRVVVGAASTDPAAPTRSMKRHAAEALSDAALTIARRGAGRCVGPTCGARLATDARSGKRRELCSSCETATPLPYRVARDRQRVERERELVDAAAAVVLSGGGAGDSRKETHRRRARVAE